MIYTKIRTEGGGAFGIVDLVQDEDGNHYAKKTLKYPDPSDQNAIPKENLIKRFSREIKFQSEMNHPNIAKVIDHNLEADPPYFIMDFAIGTLRDDLEDRDSDWSPNKPLFDILAGLEHLHSLGIYHRDLKPENVLRFEEEDGTIRYAISDFGLITGGDTQSSTLTPSGATGGTAPYAAPECFQNFKRATNKSDIYSFGAILHDIFGNSIRLPYDKLTVPNPSISRIVEKCTEKSPHRRFDGIPELRGELFNVLDTQEFSYISEAEEHIIERLKSEEELSDEHWDEICFYLEDNDDDDPDLNANVYRTLSLDRIEDLSNNSQSILSAIGGMFADNVIDNEGDFGFAYCDVLANKLRVFYEHGDVGLKSKCLVALMILGVSHNRWYVEGIFWSYITSDDIDDNILKRFIIDINVQNIDLDRYIDNIASAIGKDNDDLPEIVLNQLDADEN